MVDFLRALSIVLLLGMFYLAFKNKKFKRFLLIESVLIIVFIIGRQMYTSNLNTMDTVMWSLASDVTNKMITQSDKNIENNMHDVLSTIYDGNGFDINTSIHRYCLKDSTPSRDILKLYKELGGKIITIGSDSHKPEHLGAYIDEAKELLKEIGFDSFCTFEKMKPIFHQL